MADKKGFGSTVLGWFVVREGDEDKKEESADELIAKYANDAPPPPPEVKLSGEMPKAQGGNVDFPAVFRAAGIDDGEQGRIDKATQLLKTLPVETPKDVKKQIVEASLKAFGYPVSRSSKRARRRSRRSRSTSRPDSATRSRCWRNRRSACPISKRKSRASRR